MFKFVVSAVLTLLTACAVVVTPMAVSDHAALRQAAEQARTTSDFTLIRQATKMVYLESGGNGSCVMIAPQKCLTAGHVAVIHNDVNKLYVDEQPIVRVIKMEFDGVKTDLALLEVKSGCPCVPLGELPKVDADVALVGFPFGQAGLQVQVLTFGKLQGVSSVLSRAITTSPVAPGNSGGGLFAFTDGKWHLIGVLVEGAGGGYGGGATHLSLSIPYKTIAEFLKGPLD